MIGEVAGNYRFTEKLGEGGMGAVYKAVDVMVEREVAVKALRPEIAGRPEILERFRAEAVTLAKLNHPAIATLYSFFRHGDQYFMVMEFVPGRTLESILRERGKLAPEEAARIAARVLEGIGHAHRMGILHRDIKPANIMLTPEGAVKVTDFGIARVLGAARMTREGRLVGTLEYLAPERIGGKESELRSDLYSLGVALYEMLGGRLPFEANTDFELMRAHLEKAPEPLEELNSAVPAALAAVVAKAMAKDPDERFATAAEFRSALLAAARISGEEALEAAPSAIKPTRLAATMRETRLATPLARALQAWRFDRKRVALGAAAAVVVLAAVLAAFFIMRREPAVADGQKEPPKQVEQVAAPPEQVPQPPATPVALPEDVKPPSPTAEVLKAATPITAPITGLGDSAAKKQAPAKKLSDAERRRAALRALGVDESKPDIEKKSARQDALKALER